MTTGRHTITLVFDDDQADLLDAIAFVDGHGKRAGLLRWLVTGYIERAGVRHEVQEALAARAMHREAAKPPERLRLVR